jgi:hypothetical protein
MAQDAEKVSFAAGADAEAAAGRPGLPGGITPASVLAGSALFLILAWNLPYWSLVKNYYLGMGGFLPLEALVLTLGLLLFNRFGGALVLIAGLLAAALLTPPWHAAVYAKTPAAAKMLPPLAGWLYQSCAGLIEPAQKSQGVPALLVAAGALGAFGAGALAGRLLSAAVGALRRRLGWRELAVVFVLLSVGTYSCRAVELLLGSLTAPYKDDNRERNFKERFVQPLPRQQDPENRAGIPGKIVPYNLYEFDPAADADPESARRTQEAYKAEKEALNKFVRGINRSLPAAPEGNDPGLIAEHRRLVAETRAREWRGFLEHWKGPLKWWLPLLVLILLLQIFLAALLQRQWADHEKLMFPHAEAVRALAEGEDPASRGRRVLRSPALWIGAGLAAALFAFQGLNFYFPAVPAPDLHKINIQTFISERPWTAMDKTLSLQPFLVSIAYLLTTEVSLSIWFFGVVNQALRVACMAWGLPQTESWAVHGEWANSDALYAGAMIVFVGALLWGGRRHFWYVARRALGLLSPDAAERAEAMSSPTAFWGFWLCAAGILLWCVLVGLKLWVMAVLFGLYLVLVILVSRVVAEAGLLTAGGTWPFYPQFVFCHLFGFGQGAAFGSRVAFSAGWLSAKGTLIPVTVRCLAVWTFIWPTVLQMLPLTPFFMAGFKLTETEPRRKRLLTALMAGAVLVGAGLFVYGTLALVFERGAQSTNLFQGLNFSNWAFANWLFRDAIGKERMWSPDGFRIAMMSVGGLSMTGLLVLRNAFYWWPLHPIGMAATGVEDIWVCFLVGWLFKRAALNYGGGGFSQRVNPFFYGLIVGQFAMAAFWNIVGLCGSGCMDISTMAGILPGG